MDQVKIGKFIAQIRKERNLTQKQVASYLGVSDKTVSKWETGKGLCEVSLMLPLCELLQIKAEELLSGTRLNSEFEKRKAALYKHYGLDLIQLEKINKGAGSVTYKAICEGANYFIKYASENTMNHPEIEGPLCEYLNENGIPVCQYIKNKQGNYLSVDENGRYYSVQLYFEGISYEENQVPQTILFQSAEMLGKIHHQLKDYENLPIGIGKEFFQYMTPAHAQKSYEKSLDYAKKQQLDDLINDIEYRLELIQRFPKIEIDLQKMTCQASHGDYTIAQLICSDDKIKAVIDWTTACVHPIVWEIIRSYVYASKKCIDGIIDIDEFVKYIQHYQIYGTINTYDIKIMPYLFFYQLAVCDYYGQYFASMTENKEIYLKQAIFSTKLLRYLENNMHQLSVQLDRRIFQ